MPCVCLSPTSAPRPSSFSTLVRATHGQRQTIVVCLIRALALTIPSSRPPPLPLFSNVHTAASNSVVTPQWSEGKAAAPTGVTASVSGGTAAGGGLRQLRLGALQVLLEGGSWQRCGALDAVVLEVPVPNAVGGLLGLDFLARFDVYVNFDASRPHCVLLPPKSACTSDTAPQQDSPEGTIEALRSAGMVEAPLFYLPPPAGLYHCKVQLDCRGSKSGAIPAIVDMGSTFSIINTAAAASVGGDLRQTDQVVSGASVPGVGYQPVRVQQLEACCIRLGGMPGQGALDMGVHTLCVADLDAFNQLGLGRGPAMILGLDVLGAGGSLVLSAAGRRMWVRGA